MLKFFFSFLLYQISFSITEYTGTFYLQTQYKYKSGLEDACSSFETLEEDYETDVGLTYLYKCILTYTAGQNFRITVEALNRSWGIGGYLIQNSNSEYYDIFYFQKIEKFFNTTLTLNYNDQDYPFFCRQKDENDTKNYSTGSTSVFLPYFCLMNVTHQLYVGDNQQIDLYEQFDTEQSETYFYFYHFPSKGNIIDNKTNSTLSQSKWYQVRYINYTAKNYGYDYIAFKAMYQYFSNFEKTKSDMCYIYIDICYEGCLKCNGSQYVDFFSQGCSSCKEGYLMTYKYDRKTLLNSCIKQTEKLEDYYISDNMWVEKSDTCLENYAMAYDKNNQSIRECYSINEILEGYYLSSDKSKWLKCDDSCLTCEGYYNNCTKCKEESVFVKNDESIIGCYSINEILEGYYLNSDKSEWLKCDDSCKTCEVTYNNCSICQEEYAFFRNNQPITECYSINELLEGYYLNSDKSEWLKCDDSCITCEGYYNNCTKCKEGSVFVKNDESIIGCYSINEILEGYYLNSDKSEWLKCDDSCKTCEVTYNNCSICQEEYAFFRFNEPITECYSINEIFEGYYLNRDKSEWLKCDDLCKTCESFYNNCSTCQEGYALFYDKQNNINKCISVKESIKGYCLYKNNTNWDTCQCNNLKNLKDCIQQKKSLFFEKESYINNFIHYFIVSCITLTIINIIYYNIKIRYVYNKLYLSYFSIGGSNPTKNSKNIKKSVDLSSSSKSYTSKSLSVLKSNKNNNNKTGIELDISIKEKELNDKVKFYIDYNLLNLEQSIKLDKRSYYRYFFDLFKEKFFIVSIFTNYNLLYFSFHHIISQLFSFNICILVNIYLYNNKNKDKFNKLIYNNILGIILGGTIGFFVMFIVDYIYSGYKQLRQLQEKIKIKIKTFIRKNIILTILFLGISVPSWIYVFLFGMIQPDDQVPILLLTLLSILIIMFLQIIFILLATIFRYKGKKDVNKKYYYLGILFYYMV